MIEMPEIDRAKCNNCGMCASICYCGALTMVDNVLKVIETERCGWCAQCEASCPNGAIRCAYEIVTLEEKVNS